MCLLALPLALFTYLHCISPHCPIDQKSKLKAFTSSSKELLPPPSEACIVMTTYSMLCHQGTRSEAAEVGKGALLLLLVLPLLVVQCKHQEQRYCLFSILETHLRPTCLCV